MIVIHILLWFTVLLGIIAGRYVILLGRRKPHPVFPVRFAGWILLIWAGFFAFAIMSQYFID